MADCSICGERIPEGSRTCSVCGSSVDEFLPSATELTAAPVLSLPKEVPPGASYCPGCGKLYEPDYTDLFCVCGTGLVTAPILEEAPALAPFEETPPLAPFLEDVPPLAPILDESPPLENAIAEVADTPDVKVRCVKPSPGTPCLVLYGPDRKPLQYFALTKDATLIGRLDAVGGNFPDIDLDEWFDRSTIRRISRQHALILRSRASGTFVLRPLVGNTGTQLEAQMLVQQLDYPLQPGHRIILGGMIRLKFEIA